MYQEKRTVRFKSLFSGLAFMLVNSYTLYAVSGAAPRKAPGFFDAFLLPRVWLSAIFVLAGVILLNREKVSHKLRTLVLPFIFFTFGIVGVLPLGSFSRGMGMHPSPMCVVTKPWVFISSGGGYPLIFAGFLASFIILTVLANKSFCGWVCPVGALQEFIFKLPVLKNSKKTLNFKITNTVRIIAFILFFPVLFIAGVEIYEYINPFEYFHWTFPLYGTIIILVLIAASFFFFRPFCYLFCPLGLVTWLFEPFSIFRVNYEKSKCNCPDKCVKESYCPAVRAILDEKKVRPDCFSCGKCIEICPKDALKYGLRK